MQAIRTTNTIINVQTPYIISKSFLRPKASKCAYYDIVVFSHVRWENVGEYVKSIMKSMAKNCKVLFIEEPVQFSAGEKNTGNLLQVGDSIQVLQPKVSSIADIVKILPQFIACRNIRIGWFFSAAFASLLKVLAFDKVVYDGIDGQPAIATAKQEKQLQAAAYVVLKESKPLTPDQKKATPAFEPVTVNIEQHLGLI